MAAKLVRLGHLAVSRAVCVHCGNNILRQLSSFRNVRQLQTGVIASQHSVIPTKTTVSTNNFSTSAGAEETAEPDDLYRQVMVEVKCHDKAVLKSYTQFVTMAANELGLNLARVFQPPKVINRYTVLKSVHIYSKHMVQYEARTHFSVFEVIFEKPGFEVCTEVMLMYEVVWVKHLKHLTGSTADAFLEYIQRNLPEGMAMKVTKHRLEKIPDHLTPPSISSSTTPKESLAS